MSVLDRDALNDSPLADLHVIAGELGLDGFRRLRKADLVDVIVERQGGAPAKDADDDSDADAPEATDTADAGKDDDEAEDKPRRRGRRGGRGRKKNADPEGDGDTESVDDDAEQAPTEEPKARSPKEPAAEADASVTGTVEVLGNGSGFVRVNPPEPDDGDVYVSAAQIRRCELVSGDTVAGPVRPPRRSERYPSLVRVETINDRPADEVADRARFDDLPAAFPSERVKLGADDETLKAIEFLTPFGRGSRVAIVGASRAGKTEALRRLGAVLAAQDDLEVSVALAGVRPEEIGEWEEGPVDVAGSATFAASPDAQAQVVDRAIEQAKRVATRGAHAVVLIDGLSGLAPAAARKATAAARNVPGQGSLTVIGTSELPLGGETTVIALDVALTSTGSFPALDLAQSGTVRAESLVGDDGAAAIAKARADALAA